MIGWGRWNFSSAGSLLSKFNGTSLGFNTVTTGGRQAGSVGSLHSREVIVRPTGDLIFNRNMYSLDYARVANASEGGGDNISGGRGYMGDASKGVCSRPSLDAALRGSSGLWTSAGLGSDYCGGWRSYSGLNYDYAIFLR